MTRSSLPRVWIAVALTALFAISGFTLARFWRSPIEAHRLGPTSGLVTPGLYILCGLGPSAAYLVETSDGLVLVDTGLNSDATRLKSEMSKLGLPWTSIRAILLTHVHGDHVGGAETLRASTKAKVYAGKGDAALIKEGRPRDAFFSTFYMPNDSPHPSKVDVELNGGETLTFGDVRFQALAMPGHTPGSIIYVMERGNQKALFAGDVITMLVGDGNPHSTGLKPLGTYSAYLAPHYRGDAATYLASLKNLRAMPVPDLILPGHPESDPTPQSPQLTQKQWEAMLDVGIRDMETLLARYKADGANFLDGKPKHLLPDLDYLGDFQGLAVYGFFVDSKLFVVDAPGGPGLLDFIKARLKELGRNPVDPFAVLLTSCNAKDIGGLSELVEKSHAQVVVSAEGAAAAKAACPPDTTVVLAEDLSKKA